MLPAALDSGILARIREARSFIIDVRACAITIARRSEDFHYAICLRISANPDLFPLFSGILRPPESATTLQIDLPLGLTVLTMPHSALSNTSIGPLMCNCRDA